MVRWLTPWKRCSMPGNEIEADAYVDNPDAWRLGLGARWYGVLLQNQVEQESKCADFRGVGGAGG